MQADKQLSESVLARGKQNFFETASKFFVVAALLGLADACILARTGTATPDVLKWINAAVNNAHEQQLVQMSEADACSELRDPSMAAFAGISSCTPGVKAYMRKSAQVQFVSDTQAEVTLGQGMIQFRTDFHRDAHWRWQRDGTVIMRM